MTARARLTRRDRRHLAGALTSAAAEMLGRRYGDDPDLYAEAREVVARWLRDLPGDEWDVRLPDPATLPRR